MKKYHKEYSPRTDTPYAEYHEGMPPVFQRVNGLLRKVQKGIPRVLKASCARFQYQAAKKARYEEIKQGG